MIENTSSLQHKIESASELQAVVRTMKAMAAANISQFEQSVRSLSDYYSTVELGLGVCLRAIHSELLVHRDQQPTEPDVIHAVVFGSDLGLVGRFNETIADYAIQTLATFPAPPEISTVGSRVHTRLADEGLPLGSLFTVPNSVKAITPLVGQILLQNAVHQNEGENIELHLFYNRPIPGALYIPVSQRLLPLDIEWQVSLTKHSWPTKYLPEVVENRNTGSSCRDNGDSNDSTTLRSLIGEYLFVSLFRACTESLASENASRLAAMQRAEKNIDDLIEELNVRYNGVRQSSIDEELFDVIAGFEAMK
ncbi:F0F1 ATP synthase subunit gamma [Desulforhopalus sp. IMCC35007]|uniref:F0F1 ATP synthase subunit gamma n=1 Tax=Desulforhopalus sp. IMCC35007 TaxID=2569543 RepID=UPI0010AEC6BD|nr:F0F1 ATP synthase subunit gamma [Desulforhopalus sp. IMCC35007]TKB07006.1 F0F1 ATP synthase subunit gamma [Desulforhopalus sp. IMCC35007]